MEKTNLPERPSKGAWVVAWSAFVAGIGASLAANIAHAGAGVGQKFVAGWPPLALLLCSEVMMRVPAPRHPLARGTQIVGTVIVAGVAAVASYRHMKALALAYGEDSLTASTLPLSVDGLALVASIGLMVLAHQRRTAVAAERALALAAAGASVPPAPVPPPAAVASVPVPVPVPVVEPEPAAAAEPVPLPAADADPVPLPAAASLPPPDPVPLPDPVPAAAAEPVPVPAGDPEPVPVPAGDPEPVPVPDPDPVPVPAADPVPLPDPDPDPVPVPAADPEPAPEPEPVPLPEGLPVPLPAAARVPMPRMDAVVPPEPWPNRQQQELPLPPPDPVPVSPDAAAEERAAARKEWRDSVAAGCPLTGQALGQKFNRSERWGRNRIKEARAELQATKTAGDVAGETDEQEALVPAGAGIA